MSQLLPLQFSTPNGFTPPIISVVGIVSAVEPAHGSMILDVDQTLIGPTTRAHLEMHGRLNRNRRGPGQLSQLPVPNSVVSFTGTLFGVNDDVAMVCVDSAVYMPRPRRLPLAALPLSYRRNRAPTPM